VSPRGAKRLAWSLWGLTIALVVVSVVYLVRSWSAPDLGNEFGPRGFAEVLAILLGTVGAVVASRRPENPIGWIFLLAGALSGVQALAADYARWAIVVEGDRPAGGAWGAWLLEWVWIPIVMAILGAVAIFPDGRTLSRRWTVALWVTGVLGAASMVMVASVPDLSFLPGYPNPLGDWGPSVETAETTMSLFLLFALVCAASVVVRFRRSRGDERQQMKWLAVSASLMALSLTFFGVLAIALGSSEAYGFDWAENLIVLSFFAIPISMGIAILKYRLYDIDVVINKAVVYGALAAFIGLVYVGIVAGVGAVVGTAGNAFLSAVAAAVVALAFQPVRRWAQHLANRVVFGERATPYEVLAEFGERLGGAYSTEDVLPRMARVLGEGTGAAHAEVWLAVEGELRRAATWPADPDGTAEVPEGDRTVEVRHQGDLLGALSVTKAPGETVTPSEEKLLQDLASQAGLVLRNARLTEELRLRLDEISHQATELRASRQRLVAAQDQERRRIERNIHDGAQQQLVALAIRLRLAEQMADRDAAKTKELLTQLHADTTEALDSLRDLARGIYPPLLADHGLAEALSAQARKAVIPTEVSVDSVEGRRFPQEVEAAVYFCCLEAMQNVSKYAGASRSWIRLRHDGERLRFEVQDDGAGFDPARTPRGAGLVNMGDRLAALDGSIEVRSSPGGGTTVAGEVPAEAST
jgi:signal transduction histidine kinase